MKKTQNGISLIALVITIIVIIILAAIAFATSTRTITEANKSNIINNISEVSSAFHNVSVTTKGKEAAKGDTKTDEQVYNYVAKGGKEEEEFLVKSEIPNYTIISKDADIGIKLPKMKLESGTGKTVEVTYATTKDGKVFIWPPYEDEDKYYITDKDTVETQMTTNIKVGNEEFEIKIDSEYGTLLPWDDTSNGTGSEGESGGTGSEGESGGTGSEGESGGTGSEDGNVEVVEIPTLEENQRTYTGAPLTVELQGVDLTKIAVSGDAATDIGSYSVVVSLKDKEKYKWSNNSTDDISIPWEIVEVGIYATLYSDGELTFDMKVETIPGKTVSKKYGIVKPSNRIESYLIPWDSERALITSVNFLQEIKPTQTAYWFHSCKNLTSIKNIDKLNTSNVTRMDWMFSFCNGLSTLDLQSFDTAKVTNMENMFYNCTNLTNILASNSFITSEVSDMSGMFAGCSKIEYLNFTKNFDTSDVWDMNIMFSGCTSLKELDFSNWDTSWVTDMSYMFQNCKALTKLDVRELETDYVEDFSYMFSDCINLTELDVSEMYTQNARDMSYMFQNCKSLSSLNIGGWEVYNVDSMEGMFKNCSNISSINLIAHPDFAFFSPSSLTNAREMFDGCEKLSDLNLSKSYFSDIEFSEYMFGNCKALTELDISRFDMSNIQHMDGMFAGCRNLRKLYVNDTWQVLSDSYAVFDNINAVEIEIKQES